MASSTGSTGPVIPAEPAISTGRAQPASPASASGVPGWRTITWRWLAIFSVLFVGISLLIAWSDATRKLDWLLHDSFVRLSQRVPPADLVIVAIDPPSLDEFGRWPWPRTVQAKLFEALVDAQAKAAVVDVLYVEPDEEPLNDQTLADALDRIPATVLPVLTEGRMVQATGERLPVAAISRVADGLGHIFLPIDDDGIVRRVYLKSGFRQAHWSALGLEAHVLLQQALPGDATAPEGLQTNGLRGRRVPRSNAPRLNWVQDFEVLIPFVGPAGSFTTVSAGDLIAGRVGPAALAGKIAFVGMTATGLSDVVPTPVSALDRPVPGIEIHANVFAGLRDGVLVTPLTRYSAALLALLLLPGMVWWFSRTGPQWALFGALAAACVPIALSFLAYKVLHVWFAPLAASVPVLLSYLAWSWHRLDFINRFLERESRVLAPHLTHLDNEADQDLAGFFQHARQHLPIRDWSVLSAGRIYGSGEPLLVSGAGRNVNGWQQYGQIFRKRYDTPDALQVRLDIPDEAFAGEILEFVDSLPRVRSHQRPSRLAGSIERLQDNALKLGRQTSALRSVKIFTETIMAGSPAGFGVWNAAGESIQQNALLRSLIPALTAEAALSVFLATVGREPEQGVDEEHLRALVLHGVPWQLTWQDAPVELVINLRAVGATLAERLICASVIDVSQIRTAERSRAELMEYLAHDLRSPLVSALYLLDDGEAAGGDARSGNANASHPAIEQRIRQSLTMMDDLLHVARADSLDQADFQEVYLNGVIDAAIDEFAPQSRNAGIALRLDMPDIDLWLTGDATSLVRALKNVIGNALKFSDSGTEVTVQVRVAGAQVDLRVIDEGKGIAPEMLDKLFTRFGRGDTTERNTRGFGLGLALVAQVVRQHGGQAWAESSAAGSRITLRLPLVD